MAEENASVLPSLAVQKGMARKSRKSSVVENIGEHLTFAELKAKLDYAAARGDVETAAKCFRLLASCADGQADYRRETMHKLWGLSA